MAQLGPEIWPYCRTGRYFLSTFVSLIMPTPHVGTRNVAWKKDQSRVNPNPHGKTQDSEMDTLSFLLLPWALWLSWDLSRAAYRWQWDVFLSSFSFLQVWWEWQIIQKQAVFGMKPTQQQCYRHSSPYQSWQDFYMGILWQKPSYPITPSLSQPLPREYLSTIGEKKKSRKPTTYSQFSK